MRRECHLQGAERGHQHDRRLSTRSSSSLKKENNIPNSKTISFRKPFRCTPSICDSRLFADAFETFHNPIVACDKGGLRRLRIGALGEELREVKEQLVALTPEPATAMDYT